MIGVEAVFSEGEGEGKELLIVLFISGFVVST